MKRILNKRIRKFERITIIQYMIKWLDWELEYNEWRFYIYLNNCLKLVEKYEERQRTKFFVVVVSIKRKSVTSITSIINDTSIIVVVSKRKRERFRKISIRAWLQKSFATCKSLQQLNLIKKREHEEIEAWDYWYTILLWLKNYYKHVNENIDFFFRCSMLLWT